MTVTRFQQSVYTPDQNDGTEPRPGSLTPPGAGCLVPILTAIAGRVETPHYIGRSAEPGVWRRESRPAGLLWQYRAAPVEDLPGLEGLLLELEQDPGSIVIRGAPRAGVGVREPVKLLQKARRTPFADAPRRWLCLSVDGLTAPDWWTGGPGQDLESDLRLVREIVETWLPAPFTGAAAVCQWASSAGLEPVGPHRPQHRRTGRGAVHLNLWFWLSQPMTSGQLRAWGQWRALELPAVDDRLFSPTRPHYTAAPEFFVDGYQALDPVAGDGARLFWLDGAPEVDVSGELAQLGRYTRSQVRRAERDRARTPKRTDTARGDLQGGGRRVVASERAAPPESERLALWESAVWLQRAEAGQALLRALIGAHWPLYGAAFSGEVHRLGRWLRRPGQPQEGGRPYPASAHADLGAGAQSFPALGYRVALEVVDLAGAPRSLLVLPEAGEPAEDSAAPRALSLGGDGLILACPTLRALLGLYPGLRTLPGFDPAELLEVVIWICDRPLDWLTAAIHYGPTTTPRPRGRARGTPATPREIHLALGVPDRAAPAALPERLAALVGLLSNMQAVRAVQCAPIITDGQRSPVQALGRALEDLGLRTSPWESPLSGATLRHYLSAPQDPPARDGDGAGDGYGDGDADSSAGDSYGDTHSPSAWLRRVAGGRR